MDDHNQFTCPNCGSHYFGSSGEPGTLLTRNCTGYQHGGKKCHFTWNEADDEKYGLEPSRLVGPAT